MSTGSSVDWRHLFGMQFKDVESVIFIQIYAQEVICNLGKNLYEVLQCTIIHNGQINTFYGNIIPFLIMRKTYNSK